MISTAGWRRWLPEQIFAKSIKVDTEMFTTAALEYLSRWKPSGRLCVADILPFVFDTDFVEAFGPSGAGFVAR